MKKMEKMFAAIIAVAMMCMSFNANAGEAPAKGEAKSSAQPAEVTEMSDAQVEYESGDTKIIYFTDAQGRVTSKIHLSMNSLTGKWMPKKAYQVFFGADETIVTCARWNVESKAFNRNVQQARYSATEYPEIFKAHK